MHRYSCLMSCLFLFAACGSSLTAGEPLSQGPSTTRLVTAASPARPRPGSRLVLTADAIVFDGQRLVELRDGQVAGSHKENRNPQSLQIVPLYDAVRQALADGVRTVVITPGWHTTFRLLAEAAYTTVTAGVSEIDIAVRNPDGSPGALPHYRAVRGEGAENQLVVLVKAGHLIALQDGGRTQLASLPHVSGPASACQSDELWCRETADGCSCPDLSGMYREMARFASASSMVHLTADLDIPFSVLGRVHSTLACKRPPGTTDDLRTFIATETLKASGGDGCEPLFRHITLAILE